jgi:protein-S-isoprenylcysteine O-methyltransferase Ste14
MMIATLQQYRGLIQGKTRIVLAWVFAAALVFSAHELPTWPGMVMCFLGATLRYWASGYLRKDSKPAVGGPYAFVRNPLYLGTYLMALGTAAATGSYWLFAGLTVVFAAIYHFIILDEEAKLERVFGQIYREYCARVPRFFPYLWPSRDALVKINPDPSHHTFSWELAAKNKAYEAYLSFAGLIGFVAAVALIKKRWTA